MLPPEPRFRDTMKHVFVAKSKLASERFATMRSGKENLSLGKVDSTAQEKSRFAYSIVVAFLLSAKKEETSRV